MNSRTTPKPVGDELTNLVLFALAGLLSLSIILRVSGNVAAFLTGAAEPSARLSGGFGVLLDPLDPGAALEAPGLNRIVYWTVVGAFGAGAVAAVWASWRWVAAWRRAPGGSGHNADGLARGSDVARSASRKALLKRSRTLRPSLTKPAPVDVGYLLGWAHRQQVWASVEDSTLVLGPPRSGKGLHLVVNAVLDAPGAVVTTSTRPDTLAVTMKAREKRGPVAVFDPQRLAVGVPSGLRWSPVRGCEDPLTAMIRASGLAAATGLGKGGTENGSFWEGKTRTVLQGLLHAAALDGRGAKDLFLWSLSPAAAGDAAAILASSADAAAGWAQALEGIVHSDPRTRDSVWTGVAQALTCLSDPKVLDAVTPAPGEEFDPAAFLRENGTLYLLATGSGANTCASLVAAFIEDLVETARRLAAGSAGARLRRATAMGARAHSTETDLTWENVRSNPATAVRNREYRATAPASSRASAGARP